MSRMQTCAEFFGSPFILAIFIFQRTLHDLSLFGKWTHFGDVFFFLAHKAYCFSRHDVIVLPKRVENINCLIIGDQFNCKVYTFGMQYQGFVFRSKCFWLVIANRNAKDFLWLYYILHHTYINQCTTHTKMKSDMYVTFLFLGET